MVGDEKFIGLNSGEVDVEQDTATNLDFINQDEALKVLNKEHGSDEWDSREERSLVWKIDRRLFSLLLLSFALQYYDKTLISQAAIFGLRTDLHLTGYDYTLSSSLLYVGFLAGAYPSALLAQRFPVERVSGLLILVWGACMILTVTCNDFAGLATQRTFLGVLEGGISPIFMLVIGSWYKKSEQALRMGLLWSISGYAAFVAPFINYGLGHITGGILSPWQYMYLLAGSLTVIWAFVFYFLLPSDPISAKGFNGREKYVAVARLRINNSGVRNTHWNNDQVIEAFTDVKFWIMFFILFFASIANGCFSSMTPIIINNFGFDSLKTLLLTSPTGFVIGSTELVASFLASYTKRYRCIIMFVCQIPVLVAALMLWLLPRTRTGPLLVAVYLIPVYGGCVSMCFPLNLANCAGYTKRTVYSAGAFVAYCLGNIAGPLSYRPQDAPDYVPAFIFQVVSTIVTSFLLFAYRYLCIRENRKRDAAGILEGFDHAYEDNLTDRLNPQFRYTY
ncbi:MFS transporter [Rhizodiscina lignyota]|uniref:MFS transporter n=1 Tax=Rhizodiscina lignyota TaxID=1504668 RepID=A0A9P4M9A9_9PEZI|nr:MFS transporter [Rhizodiscina lignyota]